ncbi:hypothetical protein OEA41_001359 [Lepraria neglecta]|uniref:Uncharacterized protein n=1 Tax=Lepraria neglecta TaxID=209136 RepID=A0AAD9Z9L2_9LECA|nr:hypothetical protein OEA41_001359 [Lepraria neglecta]
MKSSADSKISAEYGQTPKYACYLLLAVTALLRNHQWLAAGAAASVMTYSRVAAIHLIVLFATNDRLNEPSSKARCEPVVLPGTDTTFLACAGIYDPDLGVIFDVINNSLLGALPIAAWSTTFRSSNRKPILIMWMLLLAISHIFYNVTRTDVNRHFQIYPTNQVEKLPLN